MKRYEYRIEFVEWVTRKKKEKLLEAVNSFGKEGWRLNRTIISLKGGTNLLLEREIESS